MLGQTLTLLRCVWNDVQDFRKGITLDTNWNSPPVWIGLQTYVWRSNCLERKHVKAFPHQGLCVTRAKSVRDSLDHGCAKRTWPYKNSGKHITKFLTMGVFHSISHKHEHSFAAARIEIKLAQTVNQDLGCVPFCLIRRNNQFACQKEETHPKVANITQGKSYPSSEVVPFRIMPFLFYFRSGAPINTQQKYYWQESIHNRPKEYPETIFTQVQIDTYTSYPLHNV